MFQGKPMSRAPRICADCGFNDSSPTPPAMCPMCHNNPKSPLAPKNAMVAGNRHKRRVEAAKQRLLMRKVNKQIAKEGGKYEAS